ncbi:MAG: L-threonine ammonia-lyase, partial [Polaromonas sp.]|nr:L-threonine ammonia-lyase [Polaromonas sp.]
MPSPKKTISGAASPDVAKPAEASAKRPRKPAARQLTPADYLKKILTARVYDVAVESALEPAKNLSLRLNNTVLLKREDQQPVFSFK